MYRNIPLSGFGKPVHELARMAVPRIEPSASYDPTALNGSHWTIEVLPHQVTVLRPANDCKSIIARYRQDSRAGRLVLIPADLDHGRWRLRDGYAVEQVFAHDGVRYEPSFRPGTLVPVSVWPFEERNALYRQLGYDDMRFEMLPEVRLPNLDMFYVALVHRKGKGPIVTGVSPDLSAQYIGARIANGKENGTANGAMHDMYRNGTNGNGTAHALNDAVVIMRPEAISRSR